MSDTLKLLIKQYGKLTEEDKEEMIKSVTLREFRRFDKKKFDRAVSRSKKTFLEMSDNERITFLQKLDFQLTNDEIMSIIHSAHKTTSCYRKLKELMKDLGG